MALYTETAAEILQVARTHNLTLEETCRVLDSAAEGHPSTSEAFGDVEAALLAEAPTTDELQETVRRVKALLTEAATA